MKLRSGGMLILDEWGGTLKVQIIGRNDVPRVEKEGRGWRDGATVLLKGADMAEFHATLDNTSGEYVIGDSGLSVKFEYDSLPASGREPPHIDLPTNGVVLSARGVSVRMNWHERTLLVIAIRSLAWRMFQ